MCVREYVRNRLMAGIIRRRAIGSIGRPVYFQLSIITSGDGCSSLSSGRYGDDVQQRELHTRQKQRQVIRSGVNDDVYYPHTSKCIRPLSRRYLHNQSTGARCRESRYIHSQSTADSDANNNIKQQQIIQSHKSDPTAKRPTQKCDPYGLQGESLSSAKCLEWMSTLEGGWTLLDSTEKDMTTTIRNNLKHESRMTDTTTATAPKFLQKQYYHHTLHDASRFLSHISLVATNINHYPFLSMERILVDDVNNIHERGDNQMDETGTTDSSSLGIDNSGDNKVPRKRKMKGWAFRSTIRCSTYRPPTSGSTNSQGMNKSESLHKDKGLTYHDFHLALSVDIEVNREEVKHLFGLLLGEE